MPCALSVRRRERHTSTEESLDEATNSGRVFVEDETRKEETSDEATCTKHLADGVGEVVNLVDAEDNMLVMGEVTIFLLLLAATYGARCW